MKSRLLIIGASGHGKVAADIAVKMNKWQSIAFLDDNEAVKSCMGFEVVDKAANAAAYSDNVAFFVAIGNNIIRERLQNKLEAAGADIITLIHPNAVIGMEVEIGAGTIVMAGAVINSSTKIGKGCIINTSSSVDHDNFIEDYVHVSPGVSLSGTVKVGKGSWIGAGSTVSNNVSICNSCIIGAGAVVIKDIAEPGIYVGVPVRGVEK